MGGRAPQRFLPFSAGGRDCVGQTLARLNLATTLAQLYGSFSFRLAEEVQPSAVLTWQWLSMHCKPRPAASHCSLQSEPHGLLEFRLSVVLEGNAWCTLV